MKWKISPHKWWWWCIVSKMLSNLRDGQCAAYSTCPILSVHCSSTVVLFSFLSKDKSQMDKPYTKWRSFLRSSDWWTIRVHGNQLCFVDGSQINFNRQQRSVRLCPNILNFCQIPLILPTAISLSLYVYMYACFCCSILTEKNVSIACEWSKFWTYILVSLCCSLFLYKK